MDEITPLCEDCGYPVGDLPAIGHCPECGRAVADSLPEHRKGSPLQLLGGFKPFLHTAGLVLSQPRRTFRQVRIGPASARLRAFMLLNTTLAAAFLVTPWVGVLMGDPSRNANLRPGVSPLVVRFAVFVLATVGVAGVLALLTWIEHVGIRFVASKRKWRLTKNAATQIVMHASVGWLAGASTNSFLIPLLFTLIGGLGRRLAGQPTGRLSNLVFQSITIGWSLVAIGMFAGFFVAMLWYEILVYIGVRACKFAADLPPDPDNPSRAPAGG
jgi:hypothetical protein